MFWLVLNLFPQIFIWLYFSRALSKLHKIIKSHSNEKYDRPYFYLAKVYSLQKKKQKAIQFLEKAVIIDPKWEDYAKDEPRFDNIKDLKKFKEIVS